MGRDQYKSSPARYFVPQISGHYYAAPSPTQSLPLVTVDNFVLGKVFLKYKETKLVFLTRLIDV